MVGFFYEKYLGFLPTLINSEICYPHLISGGIINFASYPPYKLVGLDYFLINSLIMLNPNQYKYKSGRSQSTIAQNRSRRSQSPAFFLLCQFAPIRDALKHLDKSKLSL